MLKMQHGVVWGNFDTKINGRFLIRLFGFTLLLLSPSHAAPPTPFGSWSNQGGTITATCPAGFTCADNVSSDNMVQRLLTNNASGETFIQVIIDDNTSGTHQSETFVNASNTAGLPIPVVDPNDPTNPIFFDPIVVTPGTDQVNENIISAQNSGVATQMTISQTGVNATSFDYSYSVFSGWGITPNQPSIDINFRVTDTMAQGVALDYSFFLEQHADVNENVTGTSLGLDQTVTNSAVISTGNGGGRDDQVFVLRRARGDYVPFGTATLPPPVGGMGMGMGGATPNPAGGAGAPPFGILPNPQPTPFPNPPGAPTGNPAGMGGGGAPPGGTVAWNTGAEVQVIWIGQVCPGCAIAGMGGMGGPPGVFSFQQYENITSGQSAATRSIVGSAPFVWTDPPFGPQPAGL